MSICFGLDPGCILFQQADMRIHLLKCLENGTFTQFPFITRNMDEPLVVKMVCVPIYCNCRLPDNGEEKMAECENCKCWYHKTCENIPSNVFSVNLNKSSVSWFCKNCTSDIKK